LVSRSLLVQQGDAAFDGARRRRATQLKKGERGHMQYPEQYRAEVLSAIQGLDLEGVSGAIDVFREARAHGRCIFVCGTGSNSAAAARLLCETVRRSSVNRALRFRIIALAEELSGRAPADVGADRVFQDQLKDGAERGDVVMGISPSGNSAAVVRAFEYANRIGCRTVCITGRDGGKLAAMSNIVILVPASHAGSVEDAHMIICHMIGYYFVNFDKG
jgi:D-sedoheptulose 7-phosphate isomerase